MEGSVTFTKDCCSLCGYTDDPQCMADCHCACHDYPNTERRTTSALASCGCGPGICTGKDHTKCRLVANRDKKVSHFVEAVIATQEVSDFCGFTPGDKVRWAGSGSLVADREGILMATFFQKETQWAVCQWPVGNFVVMKAAKLEAVKPCDARINIQGEICACSRSAHKNGDHETTAGYRYDWGGARKVKWHDETELERQQRISGS